MKYFIKIFSIVILLNFVVGCNKQKNEGIYGPLSIQNDTTVFMNGDMGNRIDIEFENLIEDYPDIKIVLFGECPGSRNDESMMYAANLLRNNGINTHLPSESVIESGAVDFYLAGNIRTRESGNKIGVHAWSDGNNSATDYPVGHLEHQLYIDHYIFCGFTKEEAEELYYFIINAAPPDNMYYLTEEEIEKYKITTF